MDEERMIKWFGVSHFPPRVQEIASDFQEMAFSVCEKIDPGPERTVALRKLLESRDAAVRAKLSPGG